MGSSYDAIIKKAKKTWDCEDLMDGPNKHGGKKLPFSSPLLNYSTYGGIPRDAITEFLGEPSGGKSTTAIDVCKNAYSVFKKEFDDESDALRDRVAKGDKAAALALSELNSHGVKKVLYIDLEHTFDEEWSEKLGIHKGEVDVMQPPNVVAEEVLQLVEELITSGETGLIVIDSIPSLVTRQELEKKYGERTVAALPGLLTTFFRKITPLLTQFDCTLLLINQTRDNMDNPYVVQSPGGKALKFYCSLRVLFRIGHPVDFLGNELPTNTENPAGYIVTMKIMKQKSAPNDRRAASYYLMSHSGIRTDIDLVKLAIDKYNIIIKKGGWFTFCDPYTKEILDDPITPGKPLKVNGMSKVFDWVQVHPDYLKKLSDVIISDISGEDQKAVEDVEAEEDDEEPSMNSDMEDITIELPNASQAEANTEEQTENTPSETNLDTTKA